jgi:hypothetical protein
VSASFRQARGPGESVEGLLTSSIDDRTTTALFSAIMALNLLYWNDGCISCKDKPGTHMLTMGLVCVRRKMPKGDASKAAGETDRGQESDTLDGAADLNLSRSQSSIPELFPTLL